MSKLIATLIAGVFALGLSFNASAAKHMAAEGAKGMSGMEAKKDAKAEKKEEKKEAKAEKKEEKKEAKAEKKDAKK